MTVSFMAHAAGCRMCCRLCENSLARGPHSGGHGVLSLSGGVNPRGTAARGPPPTTPAVGSTAVATVLPTVEVIFPKFALLSVDTGWKSWCG